MRKSNLLNNPYALMLMLLILWGSFAAVSKLVLRNIDSFQVQFYMFGFALIMMTAILAVNGKIKEFKALPGKDYITLVLFSLPSFLYYFLYILSLKLIPAIEASMLNYLFPIMIVVFAVPINGEKINLSIFFSVFICFAGMVIIISNGKIDSIKMTNIKGDMFAVAAAACWGLFSNLGKKNKIDIALSNYIYTFTSFMLSTICMFVFSKPVIPDITADIGLLWLGLSNIVLSYYLWFKVMKITSTALAGSLSFITPFITLLFVMLLLGEKITFLQVIGLLVILVGIAIQSLVKFNVKTNT